ncbi:MAG TPA: MaoC family dehydratase [Bryobacteraceae bacterium]|nr:MaoC family dehydratase [Bryobacteraceae bacterium]
MRVIEGVEELRALVGQEAGSSGWHTVTQAQIDRFAEVTGDDQWIHVDVERARRESPYGTTIAHGFLTVSLLSSLIKEAVEVRGDYKMRINYGFNRLRFTGSVPAGSRIRGRFVLNSMKDVEGGIEIAWGVTVEVEGREKPALVAEWLGRTYY